MPKTGGYPGVSGAHLEVAKNYSSPFLLGPPVCDQLVSLVQHMFSEEEAEIVRHLKPWRPRTARSMASATGRTEEEVKTVLDRLGREKQVVLYFSGLGREFYTILPMAPGTFEMTLMRTSTDTLTPWHERFAELFEALFSTGYSVDYLHKPIGSVRYLTVGEVIETQPMALPSDRLEVILERYDSFAVGLCQCRLLKNLTGDGCGRMLETCTVVGDWAPVMVERGLMRTSSLEEVLQIKAAAEREGLVTWMVNEESGKHTSALCSCCGCCCGALRTVSEFNTPGFIAPPHFIPEIDHEECTFCSRCVEACPMKALSITGEGKNRTLEHEASRCIGCGLCQVACGAGALVMREVLDYKKPPGNWASYFARYLPGYAGNIWKTLRERNRT
jgi:Na+-translocating ferredoxin:NAD+ oxidoreductase subunit B